MLSVLGLVSDGDISSAKASKTTWAVNHRVLIRLVNSKSIALPLTIKFLHLEINFFTFVFGKVRVFSSHKTKINLSPAIFGPSIVRFINSMISKQIILTSICFTITGKIFRNFVKFLAVVPKPKHRHGNSYSWLSNWNLTYFLWLSCRGTKK